MCRSPDIVTPSYGRCIDVVPASRHCCSRRLLRVRLLDGLQWSRPRNESRGRGPIPLLESNPGAAGPRQDPAPDLHRAGEPVVRSLLRHVPGCRRHPDEQRRHAEGVRARSRAASMPEAVPRRHIGQRGRAARLPAFGRRRGRRQDGRLHSRGPTRPELLRDPSQRGELRERPGTDGTARCHGLA